MRILSALLMVCVFASSTFANKFIDNKTLWKNVVAVDTRVWEGHEKLKEKQLKVNPDATDVEFMRRLYLDVTGTIPTYDQVIKFLSNKSPNRRAQLVDELLSSEGYVSHYYDFFADLFRHNFERDNNGPKKMEFSFWIKEQLRKNTPYDQIVRDVLLAKGGMAENGAVGFYYRDVETTTLDTVSSISKAFLGTRIGCAQCHNHRFDKWTQKEFYEFAAFLGGIKANRGYTNLNNQRLTHLMKNIDATQLPDEKKRLLKKLLTISPAQVNHDDRKTLKYPSDYVYENAKPNTKVQERIIFDDGPTELKGETKIERLAYWMTHKENKQFSRNMVNRLWQRSFGVGIVEPVDDYKADTTPSNKALLNALTDIFISLDFDIKAFLTVLYNSSAYQLGTQPRVEITKDNYEGQGHMLKRLTAEQVWDSMLTLAIGNLDGRDQTDGDFAEFYRYYLEFSADFGKNFKGKYKEVQGKADILDKGQYVINDKLVELLESLESDLDGFIAEYGPGTDFEKGYNQVFGKKNNKPYANFMRSSSYRNNRAQGILGTFGANDRSSVQPTGSDAPSITQVLELMNGSLVQQVAKKDSLLFKNIMKEEKFGNRVKVAIISVYGRLPTSNDIKIAQKFFEKVPHLKEELAWREYIIAILNTPEFLFIK